MVSFRFQFSDQFEKAKDCIPVIKDNRKCNKETTLNECKFNGDESYTGHSSQNVVLNIVESEKKLFEVEPYGVINLLIIYIFHIIIFRIAITKLGDKNIFLTMN